jgi:small conductance mechanosensitive channel
MEEYTDYILGLLASYGLMIVGAIAVLIIGLWVIKIITRNFVKVLKRSKIDETLHPFFRSMANVLMKVLLILSVLSIAGIEVTSFIAILGAAGLAIGMALSGTLQNFAGGVMILIFKPFEKGHFIEAQGHMGTVKEIQIFITILTTPDNKRIILPNGPLANGSLTNFSVEDTRRVDMVFGVGYDADVEKAKAIISDLLDKNEAVMKDPEKFIALHEMADSSVNIVMRAWVKSADYWGVYFYMNENVYKEFNTNNISIPYPQMDVHVKNN